MKPPPLLARPAWVKMPLPAVVVQLLLAARAVSLGIEALVPWPGIVGITLALVLAASVSRKGVATQSEFIAWWGCSLVYPVVELLSRRWAPDTAMGQAALLCLPAASAWVASLRLADAASKVRWRVATLAWGVPGLALVLGVAYAQNLKAEFYAGMLGLIVLLVLCQAWYRPPVWAVQALNTLILLCAGLLVAGLVPPEGKVAEEPVGEPRPVYRYAEATSDPAGFKRWWPHYTGQWSGLLRAVFEMHPGEPLFYRPRPGSQGVFVHSHVAMNNLGFRGKELAQPKGDTYRIVALGESTTFGSTIEPNEPTWPEMLEEMIRNRLHPARPVEVVNAGTPMFGITNNLLRLPQDILPLKPDLLLSYHGYNGFRLLYRVAPPDKSLYPPVYTPRPVKLLAQCEYRLRVLWYRHRRSAQRLPSSVASAVMQTRYAAAYRTLMAVARTNGMRLALATFSMAVNQQSEPGVIAFYQTGFPDAPASIQANEVHSLLVRQLCQENPDVLFVDTRPGLDGQHDCYLDLMHFNQEGDRKLAEAMFQGLRPVLERDLAAGTNR